MSLSAINRALPLTLESESRVAAVVRRASLPLAAVWLVYLLNVLTGPWGLGLQGFFRTWVFSGLLLASAAICLARATVVGVDRAAWTVLGVGMSLWALATVYWSVFLEHLEAPPYPSVADGLYLAFYPAAYIALMLLLRKKLHGLGASLWLDGLIGALSVGALAVSIVIPGVVDNTGGSLAVVTTNLAYPAGDALLTALIVGAFALTAWRPSREWLLIGVGVVLFTIADTVYLYRVAHGTFVEGTWLDAIWVAGMGLIAFAAWQSPRRRPAILFEGWPVIAAPTLFTLSSLGVLIYGNVAGTNGAAVVLAGATMLAALVRLALSFHEVRSLTDSRRQATTDELTGLANRRLLYEKLRLALSHGRREGEPVTLLVADLDGFKELNDTLGHHAGDLLLKQIGPRVLDVLTAQDTLARLGGDEFAVVLPGANAESATHVVRRIQSALDRAFTVRGLSVHIEASIGVASCPEHGDTVDALVQRADVAMYEAKAGRTGFQIYAPERDDHSRDRLGLLGDLRRAIEEDELVLHYQPKVDLRTGDVTGVEALVRWRHPKRGLLPPSDFIPLAEQTALMRPLTLSLIRAALKQLRQWLEQGADLRVAVNLSVPNLLDTSLPNDVARLLDEHGIEPRRLQLEVTENVIMADPVRVLEVLEQLRALGVGLSLDDFGTGSSSLTYLAQLPVDELKIDRSFVMSMTENDPEAVIVRSTTELAQRLGLRVVAEGVESAQALEQLGAMGCDEGQGYHLQRPLPPEELTRWFASQRTASAQPQTSSAELPPLREATA
ncbi:MAG: putative bifunctional diguanylate cyclase/phosphodiesterase [Thermoleophilaceae bacterium]